MVGPCTDSQAFTCIYTQASTCTSDSGPLAGSLMAGTNPMGLDGLMDSRLPLLTLSRCGRGWQFLLAWLVAQHAPPTSFKGDTFLPGTPRRITTTRFKTICYPYSMGSREGRMRWSTQSILENDQCAGPERRW